MAASLGSTAARGALMTLGGQGGRILLQFLGIVVLARLLDPEDYGLLAVVTVIIGVGEIFRDFGLSSAAVRAKTLSHGESSNLFWINTGIGALLGLILIAISPWSPTPSGGRRCRASPRRCRWCSCSTVWPRSSGRT